MSGNRSNRFSTLSDPHNSKSGNEGLDLNKLVLAGSGSGQGRGSGQGSGSGRGTGPGRARSGAARFINPLEQSGSPPASSSSSAPASSGSSAPRPTTIHNDPFPSFNTPSFERRGPKDPRHEAGLRPQAEVPMRQQRDPSKPPEGFGVFQPGFFRSKWPGVTWHKAVYKKKNKKGEDITRDVIVRMINTAVAPRGFMIAMGSERVAMDTLDHRFILRYTAWYRSRNKEGEKMQMVVFPKCDKDMVDYMRVDQKGKGLDDDGAKQVMGQIAQALA